MSYIGNLLNREVGSHKPHQVQQEEVLSPAPGLMHRYILGDHPEGGSSSALQERIRGAGEHQVERESAMCSCNKKG